MWNNSPGFVAVCHLTEEEEDAASNMEREDQSTLVPPEQTSKHARATSTVAQSFANDLDSMFGLGMNTGGIDTLSQTVEEK